MLTLRNGMLLVCALLLYAGHSPAEEQFTDVTESIGLAGLSGDVAAWGDFDNDGWVDLHAGTQLWRNEQGRRFVLVNGSLTAGAAIWGDANNDGWLDLFSWVGRGQLLLNQQGKGFESVGERLPALPMQVSVGAAWGDLDGDGLIDLYVGGYEVENVGYLADAIYRNLGGAAFELRETGGSTQPARGITLADFDEDGDQDVYVSNYRIAANRLWLNSGNWKLADVAAEYRVDGDGDLGAWGHTIGSAWGDLDNDGHLDLFVGNFSHPPAYQDRPKFLKNLGPQAKYHFEDRSGTAGLHWQESYASPALGDFDNDGLLDLFFTTVYPGDRSVLYRNTGDWKFADVTATAGGVDRPQTYQAAWADFDNDGCLDLVTGGRLFRNAGGPAHWLKVQVTGGGPVNRAGIGTQVRLKLGSQTLTRQVEGGTGQGNQNDLTLHFGLGSHAEPVELNVLWPDGTRQRLTTPVDRMVKVTRQAAALP